MQRSHPLFVISKEFEQRYFWRERRWIQVTKAESASDLLKPTRFTKTSDTGTPPRMVLKWWNIIRIIAILSLRKLKKNFLSLLVGNLRVGEKPLVMFDQKMNAFSNWRLLMPKDDGQKVS
jgi:hypothetical protein